MSCLVSDRTARCSIVTKRWFNAVCAQGDCPKELPSWSQALQPPVVARDGDLCLLLAERNLFFWDNTAGSDTHTVWMHNVYLRLQRTYGGTPVGPRAALIFWRPGAPGPETDKSKLFLTSSVLQGDGIAGSRPFWSENARSLLSRAPPVLHICMQ